MSTEEMTGCTAPGDRREDGERRVRKWTVGGRNALEEYRDRCVRV